MDDMYYMDLALIEAEKAFALDDVPIGEFMYSSQDSSTVK